MKTLILPLLIVSANAEYSSHDIEGWEEFECRAETGYSCEEMLEEALEREEDDGEEEE